MAASSNQLAGSAWRPVEVQGRPVADDTRMRLRFDQSGKLSAHGGCNRMFGSYKNDKINLTFGPIAATRMACGPEIMEQEAAFSSSLEATRLFLRDGNRLTLKTAQGVTMVRLVASD